MRQRDIRPGPGWADYYDPTLIAGRTAGIAVHVIVLVLAAGADLAAFYQVIAVVMRSDPWTIYLIAAGFAAVALYLCHAVGRTMRDLKAGLAAARKWLPTASLAAWLALGAAAFAIRLLVPPPDAEAGAAAPAWANSAVFLALYVSTGVVAAVGAYLTRNPWRAGYAKLVRQLRQLEPHLAEHAAACARARSMHERALQVRARAEQTLPASVRRDLAARGAELKAHARLLIASRLHTPEDTDDLLPRPAHPGTPTFGVANGPRAPEQRRSHRDASEEKR